MHTFDLIFTMSQPVLVVAMLAFWLIGVYRIIRRQNRWSRGWPLLGFAGLIGLEFASAALIQSAAREEIAPVLAGEIRAVTVKGKTFDDGVALIALLRDLQFPQAHHSHALNPAISTRIETTSGATELWLGRDSGNPREYWVFYPGFLTTQSNAVGHIFTDRLDGF